MSDKDALMARAVLKEAADKATPGPWEAMIGVKWAWVQAPEIKQWVCDTNGPPIDAATREANAAFIAAANPAAILSLLDRIEALAARVAKLEEALNHLEHAFSNAGNPGCDIAEGPFADYALNLIRAALGEAS